MGTVGSAGSTRQPPGHLGRPDRALPSQVAVVSSGVKSLLDVEATAELLETLGVLVLGWQTRTMPRFYDAAGAPP